MEGLLPVKLSLFRFTYVEDDSYSFLKIERSKPTIGTSFLTCGHSLGLVLVLRSLYQWMIKPRGHRLGPQLDILFD